MRVVYYKLPRNPENIVVGDDPSMFEECEVALLFGYEDVSQPARWKIICEDGVLRALWVDDHDEFSLFVEDYNNFWCVVGADVVDNAILIGQRIHQKLVDLEAYYDRMEDK